jgi:hypothetical protein
MSGGFEGSVYVKDVAGIVVAESKAAIGYIA